MNRYSLVITLTIDAESDEDAEAYLNAILGAGLHDVPSPEVLRATIHRDWGDKAVSLMSA